MNSASNSGPSPRYLIPLLRIWDEPLVPDEKERKPDDPAQSRRFIETAREAEADETKEGADKAFRKVASSPKAPPDRS